MHQASEWSLHQQLDADGVSIGDLALSRVLVMRDANYPWLVLVPRRPDRIEIIDLDDGDQMTLMREIALTSRVLAKVTRCDKLNVAALGNSVAQLHIHVIARFRNDIAGTRPVWGAAPPRAYDDHALLHFVAALKQQLALR